MGPERAIQDGTTDMPIFSDAPARCENFGISAGRPRKYVHTRDPGDIARAWSRRGLQDRNSARSNKLAETPERGTTRTGTFQSRNVPSSPTPACWRKLLTAPGISGDFLARDLMDVVTGNELGERRERVAGDAHRRTHGRVRSTVEERVILSSSERTLTAAGVAAGSRVVDRDAVLFVVRGMSLVREVRAGITDRSVAFGQDCKALSAGST